MSKIKDIIIGFAVSILVLILWAYKMIVTSGIPVEMSFNDSVSISCLLFLALIVYSFYVRKTKYILMNIISLLIPLFLWGASMQQALTYNYYKYDTLVSIIGFFTILISFLQFVYWKVKK
ncbi:hypothetical protein JOC70_003168 [Clostridium pascui]|uniref:hypothetical protein n=1 Tax=Clostridium pascui TaxID=46609 RepID=UPI0019596FB6|nr:hypothetical protein [Clostridium pascui]MBM7871658.1 hypothetical protein [Clostridium pascui]